MKSLLIIYFLLAYMVSPAQYRFFIQGTTPDAVNGKRIYIEVEDSYSSKKFKFKDSAIILNNIFSFTGTINKLSEKATLYAKAKDIKGIVYFVVDSGTNTLLIKPLPPKWPLYKNKLSNTQIFNSQSNIIYKSLDSLTNHYYLKKQNLLQRIKTSLNWMQKTECSCEENRLKY